jgi:hypothetical protein
MFRPYNDIVLLHGQNKRQGMLLHSCKQIEHFLKQYLRKHQSKKNAEVIYFNPFAFENHFCQKDNNMLHVIRHVKSLLYADLDGETSLDKAVADMVIDYYSDDIMKAGMQVFSEKDEAKRVYVNRSPLFVYFSIR